MKYFLTIAAFATGITIGVASRADVYIGMQQAGVNGGALTQVATGTHSASFVGPYSQVFNSHNISVTDVGDQLVSASFDLLGTAPATLYVYVTSTHQGGGSAFLSTLTSTTLPPGGLVRLSTYIDDADGVFTTPTPLSAFVANAPGSLVDDAAATCHDPCSVTGVYEVHSPGHNLLSFTDSIRVGATRIPEPSTLMLLAGFAGLTAMFFRFGRPARRR
jgi:hypothetical protein